MIPIPAILARVPWQFFVGWALIIAFALMGWRVTVWHAAHKALPGVQAALEAEQACADGSQCKAREIKLQEAVGHETVRIVTGYEAELASLRSRPPSLGSVRLCRDSGGGAVRDAPAPSRTHGNAASGVLDGANAGDHRAGPDIGPDLDQYARDCEALSASKRAITQWNQALSNQPKK